MKQKIIPFPGYKSEYDLEASPSFKVSEVELIYVTKERASERPRIMTSRDTFNVLKSVWDANKMDMVEQFNVLLLNSTHRVLGLYRISTGGLTGTIADPRLAFAAALRANATGMIISHNHPSGSTKPSVTDENLTDKFKQAGKFLDIRILDHIIMTRDAYFSFGDNGLL